MTEKRPSLHAVLAAPVVFAVFAVLFKILKIGRAYVSWVLRAQHVDTWAVVGVVIASLAAATLALICALSWLRSGPLRDRNSIADVIALLAAVGVGEMAVAVATGSLKLVSARLIGVVAWDLAFVTLLITVLLYLWRRYPRTAVIASILCSCLLLLIYTVETAFFLRTGSIGSWFLAKFLIQSYDVKGAVVEDISVWQIGAILMPQAILMIFLVMVGKRRGDDRLQVAQEARPGRAGTIGVAALLVAILFPTSWLPDSYQPHRESLALTITRDAFFGVEESSRLAHSADIALPQYGPFAKALGASDSIRKNVVVVVLESTRASSAPPENSDGLWMPFLDSLASRSLVVDRMYTTVPYTTEALLALFAGLFPPLKQLGSYEEIVSTGWPGLLAENGYATGFFTGTYLNDKRGERELLGRVGFSTVVAAEDLRADASIVRTYSGVDDAAILSPAIAWVDSLSMVGDRPFVLACLTQSSHHPYRLPSRVELRLPGTDDRELELYLNTLTYVDGFLRDLYDSFRDRGLLGSTIFILVGDHGESFGEHGARFHGMNVWEQGIRVPFILHDPSTSLSSRVDGLFQQTDLFVTAVEAAGFTLTGVDRVAQSIFGGVSHERIFVASAGSRSMALLQDSLKYVYHYRRRPMQVFNLLEDPGETIDIADRIGQGDLKAVELELLLWQRSVNSQAVEP